MKNSFKHFIKHLKCKLYINPKTHNYNINMQTSKQLSNISHLHVTLYHFLQAKSKFKETLNLKKISKTQNYNINMQTSKHLSNTSHFHVNIV